MDEQCFYLAYPHHEGDLIELLSADVFWGQSMEMGESGSGYAMQYEQVWVPGDYASVEELERWLGSENLARREAENHRQNILF